MTLRGFLAGLLIAVGLVVGWNAFSQDSKPQGMGLEEMLKMAQAMSAPTEHHKRLEALAGSWETEMLFEMPGGGSMTAKGTSEHRWVLGGRFLEARGVTRSGDLTVETIIYFGYDTRAGHQDYFTVGMDTLGTYYVTPRGQWDEKTKSFTLTGTEKDPMTGTPLAYRQVFAVEAPDQLTLEHFMEYPGMGEKKLMTLRYRRKP